MFFVSVLQSVPGFCLQLNDSSQKVDSKRTEADCTFATSFGNRTVGRPVGKNSFYELINKNCLYDSIVNLI